MSIVEQKPETAAEPVLRVEDLVVEFRLGKREVVHAVSGIDFEIYPGETLGLVGESGCGKSTTARSVMQLPVPTSGKVILNGVDLTTLSGEELRRHRRDFQIIFQDPISSLNPRRKVSDIVEMPMVVMKIGTPEERAARVREVLTAVGLDPDTALDRRPFQFSGGQCQRISIARALAGEPEFLVCDEPTSALDVSVQAQILNLMKELQNRLGLTYLFISHDLAVVYHVSTKVGVMYLGKLVEWADTKTLFENPRHPYTRMLLDAIPDLEMTGRQRIPVAGEVPSPINPPSGCAFHPRCPHADTRCSREVPPVQVIDGVSVACHAVSDRRIS